MRRWFAVCAAAVVASELLVGAAAPAFGVSRVFQTRNSDGALFELDLTQATATQVGGPLNLRGLEFGPAGYGGQALYAVVDESGTGNDRIVRYDASLAATDWLTLGAATPDPVDLTFDATGNVYVVTPTEVVKYSPSGAELLRFSHGVADALGSGNGQKPWDVAVNPFNGDILVAGRRLARFSATGTFLGDLYGNATYGYAGLAFTTDGYSNSRGTAFLYVGYIVSGTDIVYVLDSNYNQVRSFQFSTYGNPIDTAIDPATGDIFLGSSSYPAIEHFTWNESFAQLVPGSTSARGVAVGTFAASVAVPEPAGASVLLVSVCVFGFVESRRRRQVRRL